MGRAISQTIFNAWCKHMENYLVCFKKERLLLMKQLAQAEGEYLLSKNYKYAGASNELT